MKNTIDHLYLVLVPVAEVFRKELPQDQRPMMGLRNAKQCRVKFVHADADKKWQTFCEDHQLNNDASLEY